MPVNLDLEEQLIRNFIKTNKQDRYLTFLKNLL